MPKKKKLPPYKIASLVNHLPNSVNELEKLLDFAETTLVKNKKFTNEFTNKSIYLMHCFAAIHQRTRGLIACLRADQSVPAEILMRSIWEISVNLDFVYLEDDEDRLVGLTINEYEKDLVAWKEMREMRKKYLKSNTWNKHISNKKFDEIIEAISERIQLAMKQNPNYKNGSFKVFLDRIKEIDKHLNKKDSNRKQLLEFDYRAVYHLISTEVHGEPSGILRTGKQTQLGREIKFINSGKDSMRVSGVAFNQYVEVFEKLCSEINIDVTDEIQGYKKLSRKMDRDYKKLEKYKYI